MASENDIKELVIARIKAAPEGVGVSFGGDGRLSKDDLIKHVEANDEIGKKIIEVQMNFLTSLKEGLLYEQDFSD